ncbi:MAG: lmo0937 family membrane protein [Candidatus Eremiobacteraeota bacterium]|nr:lmo0937 family membrane protein [Candidatus Eremiobacteraeota bacterium]
MGNLLWTIIVILVIFWVIGLVAHIGGGLIHLVIVVAVILFIINLLTGRKAV